MSLSSSSTLQRPREGPQFQVAFDADTTSTVSLEINDPAVENFISFMLEKYETDTKKSCASILGLVGLPLDALEIERKTGRADVPQLLEKKAHHPNRDDGKRQKSTTSTATTTAIGEECHSPVHKKQKSESPKAAAVLDTPAIVVPDIELARIKRCNKKELCAELSNLGIEHNKNWKKDDLIDTWIEAKTAKPMPETQPMGYSKYAAIDGDKIDTNPAFCAVSKSPFTKISNDDSAPTRQPEVKTNVAGSRKEPGDALPPIGSVKRAIMEREARAAAAGKLPDVVASKSPLPMAAKIKSAPKPPPTPPQESSSVEEEDIKMDLDPVSRIETEPMEAEMVGDDRKIVVNKLNISVPMPDAKLGVVDSDDMEEEPTELAVDIKPTAVYLSACTDDQELVDDTETQYETAPEDMTLSQEESQRNRRVAEMSSKGTMPRFNPTLQSIPGSSQKATPGKQGPHAVIPGGLVRSAVKNLSSHKDKPNTAARELNFLASSKLDFLKPKSATTGGKLARAKPAAAVVASATVPSLNAQDSAAAALAEQKSKRLEQLRAKSQKLQVENTAPSAADRVTTSRSAMSSSITQKVREKHAQQKHQQENLAYKIKSVTKTKDLLPVAKKRAVGAAPQASIYSDKKAARPNKASAFDDEANPYNLKDIVCNPDDNYELTDTEASDYDADSDDEYERRCNKKQPSWARSENLRNALAHQHSLDYPYDPDVLFGEVETCDLVEIFNVTDKNKKIRLRRRRSSGTWDNDRLTDSEKATYKRQVLALIARSSGN